MVNHLWRDLANDLLQARYVICQKQADNLGVTVDGVYSLTELTMVGFKKLMKVKKVGTGFAGTSPSSIFQVTRISLANPVSYTAAGLYGQVLQLSPSQVLVVQKVQRLQNVAQCLGSRWRGRRG